MFDNVVFKARPLAFAYVALAVATSTLAAHCRSDSNCVVMQMPIYYPYTYPMPIDSHVFGSDTELNFADNTHGTVAGCGGEQGTWQFRNDNGERHVTAYTPAGGKMQVSVGNIPFGTGLAVRDFDGGGAVIFRCAP